jgi:hypothetical protein
MANNLIKSMFFKEKAIAKKDGSGEFTVLQVSMPFDSFVEEIKQYVNEKGWVNIDVKANKEVSKMGNTHHATVWVKDSGATSDDLRGPLPDDDLSALVNDNELPF